MREYGTVVVEWAAEGGLARMTVEHDLFPGAVMAAVIDPDVPT